MQVSVSIDIYFGIFLYSIHMQHWCGELSARHVHVLIPFTVLGGPGDSQTAQGAIFLALP